MNTLLTIYEQDVNPDAPRTDTSHFKERFAARAVLLDQNNNVHLLHVTKRGYHKLPGGGVEAGEDIKVALERELLEEVGCKAEVIAEVGQIIEYRDQFNMKQTSYCFLARQLGDQGETALEDDEIADGFVATLVPTIDAAIHELEHDEPTVYGGKFIRLRDLAFLKAARTLL